MLNESLVTTSISNILIKTRSIGTYRKCHNIVCFERIPFTGNNIKEFQWKQVLKPKVLNFNFTRKF